jgi:periplasmic protein TonB
MVLAAIFLQLSSPAVTHRGPMVVSVEWLPAPSVRPPAKPKAGSAKNTQAKHAAAGSAIRVLARENPAAPEHRIAGRHALPAPARMRQAISETSHAATAPALSSSPSPSEIARASSRNLDLVRRHLERFKFYPESARRRGIGGAVDVGFRLTEGGHVTQLRIAASSGYALLDETAEAIVTRAVPFPVDTGRYRVRLRFWP